MFPISALPSYSREHSYFFSLKGLWHTFLHHRRRLGSRDALDQNGRVAQLVLQIFYIGASRRLTFVSNGGAEGEGAVRVFSHIISSFPLSSSLSLLFSSCKGKVAYSASETTGVVTLDHSQVTIASGPISPFSVCLCLIRVLPTYFQISKSKVPCSGNHGQQCWILDNNFNKAFVWMFTPAAIPNVCNTLIYFLCWGHREFPILVSY